MSRSLLVLVLSISGLAVSSAIGGLSLQDAVEAKSKPPQQERPENPEPAKKPLPLSGDEMEKHKVFLNRLLTELQRSPRSFIYLRSIGFTETDQQFEKLIAENSAIFNSVRIVRRDEQGNRQTPGWPGISLREEFRSAGR
jgi:hypothetical protein